MLANLRGARAILFGADAAHLAFDDLRAARGGQAVADRMKANLDAAIAAVTNFQGSFEAALPADVDRVKAVYTAVKTFTDDLKSDFITVLDLRVPAEGAADND